MAYTKSIINKTMINISSKLQELTSYSYDVTTAAPLAEVNSVIKSPWIYATSLAWLSGSYDGKASSLTHDNMTEVSRDYTTVSEDNSTNGTNSNGTGPMIKSIEHLVVVSIILGLIILGTIIGNCFVIAAIILEKNLQSVANRLIASLAVADLLVASLSMPLCVVNEVSTKWHLGAEMCDFWVIMDVLCCTASILHLVAIALDRYWAVTDINYTHKRTPTRIFIMIALAWVFSALISIPPLFGWKDPAYSPEVTGVCVISQEESYTIYSTVGAFYLPLAVILVIYYKIFRAARSRIRRKHFRPNSKPSGNGTTALGEENTLLTKTTQEVIPMQSSSAENSDATHEGTEKDVNRNNHHGNNLHNNQISNSNVTTPERVTPEKDTTGTPEKRNGKETSKRIESETKLLDPKKWISGLKKNKDKERSKIEAKRERRAARTLAIITGVFVICWLPFFVASIIRPFVMPFEFPDIYWSIVTWLGYLNSLLNPVIYTVFNPDFRRAFQKILFGRYIHGRNS